MMRQPPQNQMEMMPTQGQSFDPYQGNMMPDIPQMPMPDNANSMLKVLLEDDLIESELAKRYPWIFAKDNTLTFLDKERKQEAMMTFDIQKIDELNSTPWYGYTFEGEKEWGAVRHMFDMKLNRAMGMKSGGQTNERTMQGTQFSESVQRNEMSNDTINRDSFIKRLLGRR